MRKAFDELTAAHPSQGTCPAAHRAVGRTDRPSWIPVMAAGVVRASSRRERGAGGSAVGVVVCQADNLQAR